MNPTLYVLEIEDLNTVLRVIRKWPILSPRQNSQPFQGELEMMVKRLFDKVLNNRSALQDWNESSWATLNLDDSAHKHLLLMERTK